jgi:hypothetical protein
MFDLWYDLPPILRAGLGLLLIAIAVGSVLLTGYIYHWAIVAGAVGLVFLLFSGAGNDKSGYHF